MFFINVIHVGVLYLFRAHRKGSLLHYQEQCYSNVGGKKSKCVNFFNGTSHPTGKKAPPALHGSVFLHPRITLHKAIVGVVDLLMANYMSLVVVVWRSFFTISVKRLMRSRFSSFSDLGNNWHQRRKSLRVPTSVENVDFLQGLVSVTWYDIYTWRLRACHSAPLLHASRSLLRKENVTGLFIDDERLVMTSLFTNDRSDYCWPLVVLHFFWGGKGGSMLNEMKNHYFYEAFCILRHCKKFLYMRTVFVKRRNATADVKKKHSRLHSTSHKSTKNG